MGVVEGGGLEDLARTEVLINFSFKPKGTKKNIYDAVLKGLCETQADNMVVRKYMLKDKEGKWCFSKDSEGNYFWKEATFWDKVVHYLARLV